MPPLEAPQEPSVVGGPVGVGTGPVALLAVTETVADTDVLLDEELRGAGPTGEESRYQFASGSFKHSPMVTPLRPLLSMYSSM
jgi:hypothetical protein